jgi:prolyl oligopeptidase
MVNQGDEHMMHSRATIAASTLLLASLSLFVRPDDPPLQYPHTPHGQQVDNYFGTLVRDPFRWLEADTAKAVAEWVAQENSVTSSYLEKIPFRAQLKARLEEIYNYPKYSAPMSRRGLTVFSRNNGLQNQSVLYLQHGRDGAPEVLIDPNTLSADGTARLAGYSFSLDMRYMAYGVSQGGSDWQDAYVMEVATRKVLPERLRWLKFSSYEWKGNGFYYSRFDAPADTARALTATNENQRVYFHRVGTDQIQDPLVFADPAHPRRFNSVGTTDDERFEVLYISDPFTGKRGNALYVRNAAKGEESFRAIVTGFDDNISVVDNFGDSLLVRTDRGAPNSKVVLLDPLHPEESHWTVVLPEKPDPLRSVGTAGGKIFASYMKDVASTAGVYDRWGKLENNIAFPTFGTVAGLDGEREDSTIFYTFTSFTFPTTIYEYNLRTRSSTLFRAPELKFNPDAYATAQVFYRSKDGTRIPMFIVHKKGIELNGRNPTLLYGYGGFNISTRPTFDPLLIPLLDQGVIYASPNIRGGSEYGEKWHEAGTKLMKQNVFDDFIAAAEWLIANRYTNASRLAVKGGSNGGLLVGAFMTQRPALCKVALPAVGVMDMLRFQKFTIGWNWVADYGSSDDSTQCRAILKYSPLHNLKPESYPATLVTTADHDDRVVPAHSFKFIATLQENQRGPNPVLIRIETQSGHGASSTTKRLEETADVYAFMLYNLRVTPTF